MANEKAKLTEVNDKLQYNLGEIEKEKWEIDTLVFKLKQENQACKEEYEEIRKEDNKLREELSKKDKRITNLEEIVTKLKD